MFCHKCGKEAKDGAAFCSKCGTPLTQNHTTPNNGDIPNNKSSKFFLLKLLKVGENKMETIKVIRDLTSKSLSEAQSLAENTPCILMSHVTQAEAEHIIEAFKKTGSVVTMELDKTSNECRIIKNGREQVEHIQSGLLVFTKVLEAYLTAIANERQFSTCYDNEY